MSVQLPIYTAIEVAEYQMYPGVPGDPGIRHEFTPGLHLVAGVNGLGKSTFLLMLYHGLVGPAAIKNDDFGTPKPELVPNRHVGRFRGRVADGAMSATVTVRFEIGEDNYSVTRSLRDLSLTSWDLNNVDQELDEAAYKTRVAESMDVAGFADVITILNLIVFMFEDRGLLMWNQQAQTNAFRALFTSPQDAEELATRTQAVAKTNSAYRNLLYIVNRDRKKLQREEAQLAQADVHSAEYRTLQRAVSAIDEWLERAFEQRRELEEQRTVARKTHETAKYDYDERLREVEALRLTRIANAFPTSDDSGQYVLARLIGDNECLACGAEDGPFRDRWMAAIAGACPYCGAQPESHEAVVPPIVVDAARLTKAQERLNTAKQAWQTAEADANASAERCAAVQKEIDEQTAKKSALNDQIRKIAGKVPPTAHTLEARRQRLAQQSETLRQLKIDQTEAERSFSGVFDSFKAAIQAKADLIRQRFAARISEFLVEEAEITLAHTKQPIGESGTSYEWPIFELQMTSGTFGAPAPRRSRSEVSMSQGEFIDLAFRLALVEAAVPSGRASLVFDAPEASLDALFMRRAGAFLANYTGDHPQNRLIVTSNLTNADMIPALFGAYEPQVGDPEPKTIPRGERRARVIDLLTLAAPTSAVELVGDRYKNLLDKALFPPSGEQETGL